MNLQSPPSAASRQLFNIYNSAASFPNQKKLSFQKKGGSTLPKKSQEINTIYKNKSQFKQCRKLQTASGARFSLPKGLSSKFNARNKLKKNKRLIKMSSQANVGFSGYEDEEEALKTDIVEISEREIKHCTYQDAYKELEKRKFELLSEASIAKQKGDDLKSRKKYHEEFGSLLTQRPSTNQILSKHQSSTGVANLLPSGSLKTISTAKRKEEEKAHNPLTRLFPWTKHKQRKTKIIPLKKNTRTLSNKREKDREIENSVKREEKLNMKGRRNGDLDLNKESENDCQREKENKHVSNGDRLVYKSNGRRNMKEAGKTNGKPPIKQQYSGKHRAQTHDSLLLQSLELSAIQNDQSLDYYDFQDILHHINQ